MIKKLNKNYVLKLIFNNIQNYINSVKITFVSYHCFKIVFDFPDYLLFIIEKSSKKNNKKYTI